MKEYNMLILAHTAVLKTVVYKKVSLSSPGALLIAHKGKSCGGHPDIQASLQAGGSFSPVGCLGSPGGKKACFQKSLSGRIQR